MMCDFCHSNKADFHGNETGHQYWTIFVHHVIEGCSHTSSEKFYCSSCLMAVRLKTDVPIIIEKLFLDETSKRYKARKDWYNDRRKSIR